MNYKELSKLISDCVKPSCPFYSKFFNKVNAQSDFRKNQFRWSQKFPPPKISIKNNTYGAKLAIIMESPPPHFNEYFYGDEGGLFDTQGEPDKEQGLYACILKSLIKVEGEEILNSEIANKLVTDKKFGLSWIASHGIIIIDAAKCRFKISDAFNSEKATLNEKNSAFHNCSTIIKYQINLTNPFRIVIGIASVYDSNVVQAVINDLDFTDRFIDQRILAPFHGRSENFINVISEIIQNINITLEE